jgi:hypothetical protein
MSLNIVGNPDPVLYGQIHRPFGPFSEQEPDAYAVFSVLHRPVEIAANTGHLLG